MKPLYQLANFDLDPDDYYYEMGRSDKIHTTKEGCIQEALRDNLHILTSEEKHEKTPGWYISLVELIEDAKIESQKTPPA